MGCTIAALALALGCGFDRTNLTPLPEVALATSEAAVVDHVTEQQRTIQTLLAADTPDDELALAYGELGSILLAYDFADAATPSFQNAVLLDHHNPRWVYLLAWTLQRTGRVDEAVEEFTRYVELEPESVLGHLRLGRAYSATGHHEAARAAFERALQLDPAAAAAHEGLGDCASARDDHESAVTAWEKALELQPDASSLRHKLARSLRRSADALTAQTMLEGAGEAPVLIGDPLLEQVADLSRSVTSYRIRAAEAMARGRFANAEALYAKALEIAPGDARTLWEHGLCLDRLGDGRGAVRQLRAALLAAELNDNGLAERDLAAVHQSLAAVLTRQEKLDEALTYLDSALALDASNQIVRAQMAATLARAGRLADALEQYNIVVGDGTGEWPILLQRGAVLMNLGRRTQAIADFRRVVDLAPESPEARLRLAEALEYAGDRSGAAAARAQASELAADDEARAGLLLREVDGLVQRGDFDSAITRCRDAVDLAPALTDARFRLASLLGHVGRHDEALFQFEETIAADRSHGPAHYGRITVLLLTGRWGDARTALEQALMLRPSDRRVAHALARLLAIAPEDEVRDGTAAVRLALKVLEGKADLAGGATLAMAYAEEGDLNRAIEVQRRVVAESRATADGSTRARVEAQLRSYQGGQAWRATSADDILIGTLVSG